MAVNIALETTMGTITLELYPQHAPKTCLNFRTLIQRGYYDNLLIHRIIANFMIQSGDPTGTGRGGTSIYGDKFEDEIIPPGPPGPSSSSTSTSSSTSSLQPLKHTGAGILSMANSGPNTNGSQFFLTLAPTPWLDGKHTIFGRVTRGMGVLKRMGMVRTGEGDRPVEEVRILRGWVLEGEGEE
ncbi:Peptidyl-prolyl cis-trans isomerase-like 1 [Ciborinia camelliae]|nr:Peptidyl-prolyl cis-trans isomerase-like 1 [Ciborinia camelliae]